MKPVHLFEFMDQDWLPAGLRITLREILECGNSLPFRPYYSWVADEVLRAAREQGMTTIVELGAGTAPITRHLAEDARSEGIRLVPSDINPDAAAYRALEAAYPGRVRPCYEPVDFSRPNRWDPGTLAVLSATFHHLPHQDRENVLSSLEGSAERVMIFEPLRRTPLSVLFVFGSLFPAMVLPAWWIKRPGRLRRVTWCWLVPVAPLMFCWDGVISCLRQWTTGQWQRALAGLSDSASASSVTRSVVTRSTVTSWAFCQKIAW